jgi:Circularly permutated YpsA SLOG family
MALLKIISGGQTGVVLAAVDAVLAVGFSCGGWYGAAPENPEGESGSRT